MARWPRARRIAGWRLSGARTACAQCVPNYGNASNGAMQEAQQPDARNRTLPGATARQGRADQSAYVQRAPQCSLSQGAMAWAHGAFSHVLAAGTRAAHAKRWSCHGVPGRGRIVAVHAQDSDRSGVAG